MQWGIEFDMRATNRPLLSNFPEPTIVTRFTTITGQSDSIRVVYLLEHAPQSWKEMQRLAGIKEQMAELLPDIRFTQQMEYDSSMADMIGSKCKLNALGKYFPKYIKFPTPLYPQDKGEFMKNLTLYAKRLHYQNRLYFESLLAIAIHFNECLNLPYSRKELQAKAISVLEIDRSGWNKRLSEEEQKEAHSKGGKKRGKEISKAAFSRYETVVALLPEYKKKNGKYDILALIEVTQLSRRTIYSYINRVKASAPL